MSTTTIEVALTLEFTDERLPKLVGLRRLSRPTFAITAGNPFAAAGSSFRQLDDCQFAMHRVRERQEHFIVEGVLNVAKVRKELFDALNNRQKVSANLLTDSQVREIQLADRTVILVEVPRATRKQRPIYLTTNPFTGHTYRRLNDGDRPLPDDEVKRMLAEQVEDSRDDRILRGYDMEDIDSGTFRAYRQIFANREPGHLWNAVEDREFLRQIGGWRKNRETGESGLTVAGLLMFGHFTAIQEELPNYMLDYQERPEARTESRWIDRVTLDGKWSGNLFDFYRKVYLKLTADLKVPFQLEKGERKDETPVHEALREALANVLVHADYSDRASVLVVKRPDMFGFRNPGLMRIPVEVALLGGEPDCRNRTLHKMFRFVGVGEQAGTGIPKILHGWRTQHWNPPKLHDTPKPYNQTLLELRTVDLFPEEVMAGLKRRFRADFERLNHVERVALALAASEGTVNHARLRALTTEHPVDLSKMLQHLTQAGMLESTGGRGAVYHLPGEAIPTPDDVFGPPSRFSAPSSPNLGENRDADGCLVSDQLALPVIDDMGALSALLRRTLEALAAPPRRQGQGRSRGSDPGDLAALRWPVRDAALAGGAGSTEAGDAAGPIPLKAGTGTETDARLPKNSDPRTAGIHDHKGNDRMSLTESMVGSR